MALVVIIALTMITMGTQIGFAGKRRFFAVLTMVLAFASLIILVVDMNCPIHGLITVEQQSMINLQNVINPIITK